MNQDIGRAIVFSMPVVSAAVSLILISLDTTRSSNTVDRKIHYNMIAVYCLMILFWSRAGHAFHRPRHVHSIPARFLFLIRFHPRIPLPDHAYYYGYGRAETFSGLSFHPSGVFDPNYLRDCVGSPAPAAMGSYL